MYRLWLIFAQAATVAVAVLFVVSTFVQNQQKKCIRTVTIS